MERVMGAGVLRQEIREALQRGAVVVTANERAARGLRRDWDELLRLSGRTRWEPAGVMSWSAWTVSLWRKLVLDGRTQALLLNSFQEHAVWRGVVAADPDGDGLQGIDGLAAMAAETWARLCAYVEPASKRIAAGLRDDGSKDTAAFARWTRAFERRCETERLVTLEELNRRLTEALRAGELRSDVTELVLVGFDRFTPVQERLLGAMRSTNVTVSIPTSGVEAERKMLVAAPDELEELKACARWAAALLDRNPEARVAVIVPDLAMERAMMERVLREVMAPELESIGTDEASAPYEFSLGRALAEMPLIAVALDVLRWGLGSLPLEAVSGLIVSDAFAQGNEREARAAFDAFELRRIGMLRPEITLSGLARILAGSRRSAELTGMLGAVRRLARTAQEFSGTAQGFGLWAQSFRELLASAGWGPAGTETSEEFQIRERWESALDAMSTLDFEDRAVEYAEALQALERIVRETVFAPASRATPVQVMGPLEAAGSEFDAVWFLRAGELSWPPEVVSLPLVSWSFQRDLRMPGTDAGRDLEAARAVTERLLASGREVVVSYAEVSGDARQRASPLVRDVGLEEIALEALAGSEAERVVIDVERVEDSGRIAPLPDRLVSGGVRVLELQAACGFRAFAEHRLWSRELESRDLGLDARESGTAVHRALEFFWSEVESQAKLLSLGDDELQAALSRAIEEGLQKAESHSAGAWDEAYLATQRERLRRLLNGWLEMEKARPAFVVTQREEEMRDVQVGPLRLRLRVDRVDLVDEAEVLIDYKTAGASPSDWLGERPDSPQVPLYAILAGRAEGAASVDLGAVAFGTVRAGKEAKLKGFAARAGLLPGRLPRMDAATFEAQVDRWREVLERLAEEFAAGDARVRPKNFPVTCGRCGQRMLCRLDASLLEEMEEDGLGEGEDG